MALSNLARQQHEFLAQLTQSDRPLPEGWGKREAAGIAVYRNAYRARLVDTLRNSYPRTERWVGDEAFRRAAVHHVISHPPSSWTLEAVGDGFSQTLGELFAGDPEVAELAWLEWAMGRCYVAADVQPLDLTAFADATATFAEEDWAIMRLSFLPGTCAHPVRHGIVALWRSLGDEPTAPPNLHDAELRYCLVWREGLRPVCSELDVVEGTALTSLLEGGSYGQACAVLVALVGEEAAAVRAGVALGGWLQHGLVAAVTR